MGIRVFEPDSLDEELVLMEELTIEEESITFDQFTEKIGSLLGERAALVIDRHASIGEAVRTMQSEKTGSLAVVDAHGHLVGIVTERDVLNKVVGKIDHLDAHCVEEIMTPHPETLRADDMLLFALSKMHCGGFRHVPIVDTEGRPTAMLSVRHVLAHMLARFERKLETLPPDPYHGDPQLDVGYG